MNRLAVLMLAGVLGAAVLPACEHDRDDHRVGFDHRWDRDHDHGVYTRDYDHGGNWHDEHEKRELWERDHADER